MVISPDHCGAVPGWGCVLRLSLAGIDDREYKQDVGGDLLGRAGDSAQLELHLAGAFGVVRDGVRLADDGLGAAARPAPC